MKKANELRGWKVTDLYDSEGGANLIFARSCAKAKTIAHCTENLCETEWIDIICVRFRKIDHYARQFANDIEVWEGELPYWNAQGQRVFRALGWFQIDEPGEECGACGLHEWSMLPESVVWDMDEGMLCGECGGHDDDDEEGT